MSRPRRNWRQSNASLINRGKFEMWVSKEQIAHWHAKTEGRRKRGRQMIYSKTAILICHLVRILFGLPYRQSQGLLLSLSRLAALPIPHYSMMCRRFKDVETELPKLSRRRPSAIVLDSTGLKLYGPGEWLAFKHRQGRYRKWLKLHIALDPESQEVLAAEITDSHTSDSVVGAELLKRSPRTVKEVIGDGAYDTKLLRQMIRDRGATPLIPPKQGAVLTDDSIRNDAIKLIWGLGNDSLAKGLWKKLIGYGRRSLVETFFSRLKRSLGASIRARHDQSRRLEVTLKLLIMNMISRSTILLPTR